MGRAINRLTAREVSAKPPGLHADGAGLYLLVESTGARRWTFIFRWDGKRAEMGLGSVLSVSLATARERAQKARQQVAAGQNPIELRRRRKAAAGLETFGALADQVLADLRPQWTSPVHIRDWERALTVHAAPLRPKIVSKITTEDVLAILKPIWLTKPETARKVRGRIEYVLDAAKVRGLRDGENPARWKGHLAMLLPKRRKLSQGHHAALLYDAIGAFCQDLRGNDCVSARALEFLILTVTRTTECRLARPEEINLDEAVWEIPAERMKRKIPFRVPLSPRAVEIARERIGAGGKFLFPGPGGRQPISNMAMYSLLPHMGHGDITVHGFRSTFRDWGGDKTRFSREVLEAALHHRVGDDVESAYRRGDAIDWRRQLMEAWQRQCDPAYVGQVIPLVA